MRYPTKPHPPKKKHARKGPPPMETSPHDIMRDAPPACLRHNQQRVGRAGPHRLRIHRGARLVSAKGSIQTTKEKKERNTTAKRLIISARALPSRPPSPSTTLPVVSEHIIHCSRTSSHHTVRNVRHGELDEKINEIASDGIHRWQGGYDG